MRAIKINDGIAVTVTDGWPGGDEPQVVQRLLGVVRAEPADAFWRRGAAKTSR